jgi:two-component system LytT family sensor kinase
MGELLNLVGLSAGVVLYTVLLAMVVRAGRAGGPHARFDPLMLVTAVLGLVWNLCALPVYELPKVGIPGPFLFLAAVGFSALGLLPAVVVHSVLRGERDDVRSPLKRSIAAVAYTVSVLAAILHFGSAWAGGAVPSALGMRLLTYTFVALIVPLGGVTRGQPGARRALWAVALATFAVSALHLSQIDRGESSWPVELVGHHASLPLAFAILYQDYPFALADLFLKRALTLLSLVTIALMATVTFGARSTAFDQFVRVDPRQVGALVTLWVATALVYPAVRRGISWFVDTVVLHRPDYRSLRAAVTRRIHAHDSVPALLTDVCALLAPALNASSVSWRDLPGLPEDASVGPTVVTGSEAGTLLLRSMSAPGGQRPAPRPPLDGVAAVVIVPATESPRPVITIGALTGGRRVLSDDLIMLEAIAVVVGRRIDALRITEERYHREIREQEMSRLATEAELRALRAQINPHFLFNALTTIGHLIQTAPPRALDTLMRLTSLLRGVLRSEGEYTTLGRELEIIESYLDIERARFEHRLLVRIDVPARLRTVRVPSLVLQPLVENAVKHGIAPHRLGGRVTVRATLEGSGPDARQLALVVHDTGAGTTEAALQRGRTAGVGLRNIERRLACQYGDSAWMSIRTTPGEGTTVEIRLPVDAAVSREASGAATQEVPQPATREVPRPVAGEVPRAATGELPRPATGELPRPATEEGPMMTQEAPEKWTVM